MWSLFLLNVHYMLFRTGVLLGILAPNLDQSSSFSKNFRALVTQGPLESSYLCPSLHLGRGAVEIVSD